MLHSHWNVHRTTHGLDTPCNPIRVIHETSTKIPILHSVTRTAHVEVHLIIAPVDSNLRAPGKIIRIITTELQ